MRCVLTKAALPAPTRRWPWRGTITMVDPPGEVPPSVREQAVEDVVQKSLPRVVLVLWKSYVKAHTRTLPNGRTVTVHPYFTKRIPKGEGPKKARPGTREPPPKGVYQAIRPEQLTARLVRHVREGKLTHAEAHANLEHLERRAHAGHHLEHGHGPSWTPEETHAFISHARGRLKEHAEEQEAAQREAERQQAEQAKKKEAERQKRRERRQHQKEREGGEKAKQEQKPAEPKEPWHMTEAEFYEALTQQSVTKFAKTGVSKINPRWRHPVGKLPKAQRDEAQQAFQYDPRAMEYYAKARALGLDHEQAMIAGYEVAGSLDEGSAYKRVRQDAPAGAWLHADYSTITDTQPRIKEERRLNQEHFPQAPPLIQAALRKARALNDINPQSLQGETGNAYYRGTLEITFHPEHKRQVYPDIDGPIWRHEYGHHVDHEMTGGKHYYASFQVAPTLEGDRTALMQGHIESTDETAVNARRERRRTEEERLRDAAGGHLDRTQAYTDAWAQEGLTVEDMQALLGDLWNRKSPITHARLLVGWREKDASAFFGSVDDTAHKGMIEDAIGAVTRNTLTFTWGHPDDYYRNNAQYNQSHTTEAYANWFSTQGAAQPTWRKVYAHFLPATNKAFEGLTHQWLTMTT